MYSKQEKDDHENVKQTIQKLMNWCETKQFTLYKDTGFAYEKLEMNEIIQQFNLYQSNEVIQQRFMNLFFEKIDSEWFIGDINDSDDIKDVDVLQFEIMEYMK